MPDFLIRDLDETLMKKLRERAEHAHRSLQAEIKDTLRRSVRLSKEESLELLGRTRAILPPSTHDSTIDIREMRDR
ncbi:MAG: hypothetical protein U1E29_00585 [Coriobacteriia bacterium]|nr:hypothetical protein [Coriobacteriia bacterium]